MTAGRPEDPWTEILAAWAAAIALVFAAWRALPEAVAPFAAAAVWSGIPIGLHLARGRPLAAQGIAWVAPRRTIKLVAIYSGVFLPLYAAGFFAWLGAAGWRIPGVDVVASAFVGNLFFAALPEEIFFRGFVQARLTGTGTGTGTGTTKLIAGIPISRAIVAAAALFAVTHVVFLPHPFSAAAAERLLTFFPGLLFGALREETGDVVAPALFHALCNAWLYSLQHGYLG